jgi:hypothetical protein
VVLLFRAYTRRTHTLSLKTNASPFWRHLQFVLDPIVDCKRSITRARQRPGQRSQPEARRASRISPQYGKSAGSYVDLSCFLQPILVVSVPNADGRKHGRRLIWLLSAGWYRMTKVRRGASSCLADVRRLAEWCAGVFILYHGRHSVSPGKRRWRPFHVLTRSISRSGALERYGLG